MQVSVTLEQQLLSRLRHKTMMLRYKLVPTDQLIARIAQPGPIRTRHTMIEVLKERQAHQDGSLEGIDWSDLTWIQRDSPPVD